MDTCFDINSRTVYSMRAVCSMSDQGFSGLEFLFFIYLVGCPTSYIYKHSAQFCIAS